MTTHSISPPAVSQPEPRYAESQARVTVKATQGVAGITSLRTGTRVRLRAAKCFRTQETPLPWPSLCQRLQDGLSPRKGNCEHRGPATTSWGSGGSAECSLQRSCAASFLTWSGQAGHGHSAVPPEAGVPALRGAGAGGYCAYEFSAGETSVPETGC